MNYPWTPSGPSGSEMAELVDTDTGDRIRLYAWRDGWIVRNRALQREGGDGAHGMTDAKRQVGEYVFDVYGTAHFVSDPNSFHQLMETSDVQ